MGMSYSLPRATEHISYIRSSFDLHKDCIEGLMQVCETQSNLNDIYFNSTDNQVPAEDNLYNELGNNDESADERRNEYPLLQFDINIKRLVKSNQALIKWHLKKVNISLSTLEEHMMESIRLFGNTSDRELDVAHNHIDKIHTLTLHVRGYKEYIEKLGADISKKNKDNENLRQNIEELGEQTKILQERIKHLEEQIEILQKRIKDPEEHIKILQERIKDLEEKIKILQERNTLLETTEAALVKNLKEQRDTNTVLRAGMSKKTTENEQLRQNIKDLDEQLNHLQGKNLALESAETFLTKEMQNQVDNIKELSTESSKKTTENEQLRQNIEELDEQLKFLQRQSSALESAEISLRKEIQNQVDKIKELRTECSKKTTENEQLRQNIEELGKQLKILQGKSSALESAEISLRKEIQNQVDKTKDLTIEMSKKNTENEELKQNVTELESAKVSLTKELTKLSDILRIQMFYPHRKDTMPKVSCEFKTLLANKLNLERRTIQFIDCQTEDDVNPEMLLFVVCINTSRLETDVKSTLQKLKECATRNAALIVFHRSYNQFIKVKKAPVLKCVSSCSSLGGMFDVVGDFYMSMYNCADNNSAIDGILNFIYENL